MRENPYQPFRRVRGAVDSAKRVTDERFGAWELGYNARCPEGWIVVRLDEHEARMRECEALRLEREDARSERDAASEVLALIYVMLTGAEPMWAEMPFDERCARAANEAQQAFLAVSGSSEPR